MKYLLVVAVLLSACVTVDPVIAKRVAIRRQAADRLESCLGWRVCHRPSFSEKEACKQESIAFCHANGLEGACGMDDLWTRQYDWSRCSRLSHF